MRIVIDSYKHYMLRRSSDKTLILEFPEECTYLDGRAPYRAEEGKLIAEITDGTQVEFVATNDDLIYAGRFYPHLKKDYDWVFCGDDFYYTLVNWDLEVDDE